MRMASERAYTLSGTEKRERKKSCGARLYNSASKLRQGKTTKKKKKDRRKKNTKKKPNPKQKKKTPQKKKKEKQKGGVTTLEI